MSWLVQFALCLAISAATVGSAIAQKSGGKPPPAPGPLLVVDANAKVVGRLATSLFVP